MSACIDCCHFRNEPRALEAALAGVGILSSVYGAVRAYDGLCELHERYVAGYGRCERFQKLHVSSVGAGFRASAG